jgi:hypothetical protein
MALQRPGSAAGFQWLALTCWFTASDTTGRADTRALFPGSVLFPDVETLYSRIFPQHLRKSRLHWRRSLHLTRK